MKKFLNKIVEEYKQFPQVCAISRCGSSRAKTNDALSDIDLEIFTDGKIPINKRLEIVKKYSSKYEVGGDYFGGCDEFWVDEINNEIDISYFDKKEDDLVESILQSDDDIEHVVNSCMNYYKKFASMFKFYLDKTVLTHYISGLNDAIVNLNLTRRIISISFDEWVRNNQFFDDFSRMIKTFEDIGLSNNDQFSIVMETIWKNMNTDLLNVDSNCSVNFLIQLFIISNCHIIT